MAIYTDGGIGAWTEGITALEQFLKWKGLSYEEVDATLINSTPLTTQYDIICFPGGYAYYYKLAINDSGIAHIRDFVAGGGAYLGICAGAYFACDSIIWEEDGLLDYPLDLFDGIAIGAIDSIAPWDQYTMTWINLNPNHPINQFEPAGESILYYGAPYFIKHPQAQMDTIGTYQAYHDLPGMISFSFGQGRVLFLGPHAEIEEDSDRDSTTFADELNDSGSDWPFLWSAFDWLLGQPITYPSPSALESRTGKKLPVSFDLSVYPNPFNDGFSYRVNLPVRAQKFTVTMLNSAGQKILQQNVDVPLGAKTVTRNLRLNHLSSGVYFLVVQAANLRVTRKVVHVR